MSVKRPIRRKSAGPLQRPLSTSGSTVELSIQNGSHVSSSQTLSLTQLHSLVVQPAAHSHQATNIVIIPDASIAPHTMRSDIQRIDPGAVIELFILDPTNLGAPGLTYFVNDKNALGTNIVWQGNTYNAYPIKASGFAYKTNETQATPKLIVSNIAQTIAALCREYENLLGAKITRKLVPVRYLDSANFSEANIYADPTAELESSVWFINRKVYETKAFIEFELASPIESFSIMLPRRQIIQNMCPWRYRGSECGYSGGPVATVNDSPTADPTQDVCGKRVASCKMRFGVTAVLPFGGFPGSGLYR